MMSKFIGLVSAYAYAQSKGYTGTEEEFAILMAEYASVTETAVEAVRIATESARSAAAASSDVNRAAATVTQQAAQVHDDAETSSESAATASEAKETAVDKALDSEAYALGTRDGEDVGSSDPAYHNNAKYYAESVGTSAQTASEAAQTATQKAGEAQASASAAAESARTLTIDATLTQSGQAADSKAVGDVFDSAFDVIKSPNVFNGNLTDGYINLSGATGGEGEYAHTDLIPVTSGTLIATGDNIINGRRVNIPLRFITAYDSDGTILPAYGQQRIGADNSYIDTDGVNIVTLDSNVKYVVLSIYKPTLKYKNSSISVSFDTTAIDYQEYGTRYVLKDDSLPDVKTSAVAKALDGKTIAVFGDSIMYGAGSDAKGPADLLAEKYNMILAKYCVSGATMGVRTDDPQYTVDEAHHIAKQVRNAISAGIAPDVIIFNGGTNDIGGQIPIGTMSAVYTQPSSESYFADGFETVAYLLTKNFVGVPIVYLRAHNMSSRTYQGQIDYGELGNSIAEKWGIETADMYKQMNTQLAEYRTAYLADYTHPNEAGYNKYYIPAIENFVFNKMV